MVKSVRKLIGATNPLEAEPGTIRGDLAVQTGRNVIHGSDSPKNGERETGAEPPLHRTAVCSLSERLCMRCQAGAAAGPQLCASS